MTSDRESDGEIKLENLPKQDGVLQEKAERRKMKVHALAENDGVHQRQAENQVRSLNYNSYPSRMWYTNIRETQRGNEITHFVVAEWNTLTSGREPEWRGAFTTFSGAH